MVTIKMKEKKMAREIKIKPVLNGFIVNVSCKEVVFIDIKTLGKEIERYYRNPEEVEKEYLAKALNKTGPEVTEEQEFKSLLMRTRPETIC
ncbi:MAG TPA: hypothetical protein DCY12_08825 [Candidatus Atribacteria bacterium]|nr:hypothetical protein [Candidatus Atribacteria bacterium]